MVLCRYFFTTISTSMGVVMFLRFGYAVGSVGFLGTVIIIMIGHPQWKTTQIKIFTIVLQEDLKYQSQEALELIQTGRLPISVCNIKLLDLSIKEVLNEHSKDSELTIVGFRVEDMKPIGEANFEGYEQVGNVLFVNSTVQKEI